MTTTELTPELAALLTTARALPPELLRQVADFAEFLGRRSTPKPEQGRYGPVDESDSWSEEDLRDFSRHSATRLLETDPTTGTDETES